eukprot:TRINITY_DN2354_c0_g1_i1.p1 TRINITY_DN2354_c0_g1~~TRINITY_DN2354_c0_g1_i1.p1  ORF type:complete len:1690 (+),score=531.32 TRINITY_DN2354_c0_g1_i1:171-5240(+)
MNIMMQLPAAELENLREDFDENPDGLPLNDFIRAMLKRLPAAADKVAQVADLVELFAQVDVNGDGSMEWEEFSAFCIEAGMAATRHTQAQVNMRYQERISFVDNYTVTQSVSCLRYIPEFGKLFIVEADADHIRVFDANTFQYLHNMTTYSNRKYEGGAVLAFEFIQSKNLIVISSSDLAMTFWDVAPYELSTENQPRLVNRAHLTKAQRKLCWAPSCDTLFSSDACDHIIVAWNLTGEGDSLRPQEIRKLKHHTDVITDLVMIPHLDMLVSSSLDNTIAMWDLEDGSLRAARQGHSGGVNALAFSDESGVLLSAGFDYDVLAWDLFGPSTFPLYRLVGHTCPVMSLAHIPGKSQAVSVDDAGNFRWWNLLKTSSIMDSERCLQVFTADSQAKGFGSYIPSSMCFLPNGILLTGAQKLKQFQCIRVTAAESPPSKTLFNDVMMQIVVAIDKGVAMFDAITGACTQRIPDIISEDITGLEFDARKRKFIVSAQNGEIGVYNMLNGAPMKEASDPHEDTVSSLIYCYEDQVCITASWDRSIIFADEMDPDELAMLRKISNAHDSDISTCAFSYELSLLASGAANGNIRVWDYQMCTLDGECCGHQMEITALEFLSPFPVLVAADASGWMSAFAVRPWFPRYKLLTKWRHVFEAPTVSGETATRPAQVTCLVNACGKKLKETIGDPFGEDAQILYAADETGRIQAWDFSELLKRHNITPIREDQKPCNQGNYNPQRKLQRDGRYQTTGGDDDGSEMIASPILGPTNPSTEDLSHDDGVSVYSGIGSKKGGFTATVTAADSPMAAMLESLTQTNDGSRRLSMGSRDSTGNVKLIHQWSAHDDGVRSLQLVHNPPLLLTSSFDRRLRLWAPDGTKKGELATRMGSAPPTKWEFNIDVEKIRCRKLDESANVMVEMKDEEEAEKMKQISDKSRRNSIIELKKELGWCSSQASSMMAGADFSQTSEQRARIFGQMMGLHTWDLTPEEVAREKAASKEGERKQKQKSKENNKAKNKGAELSQDDRYFAEMWDDSSKTSTVDATARSVANGSTSQSLMKSSSAPSITSNEMDWGVGSANRQRQMYPSLYSERHRAKMKKQRRLQVLGSGEQANTQPSTFLKRELRMVNIKGKYFSPNSPVFSRRRNKLQFFKTNMKSTSSNDNTSQRLHSLPPSKSVVSLKRPIRAGRGLLATDDGITEVNLDRRPSSAGSSSSTSGRSSNQLEVLEKRTASYHDMPQAVSINDSVLTEPAHSYVQSHPFGFDDQPSNYTMQDSLSLDANASNASDNEHILPQLNVKLSNIPNQEKPINSPTSNHYSNRKRRKSKNRRYSSKSAVVESLPQLPSSQQSKEKDTPDVFRRLSQPRITPPHVLSSVAVSAEKRDILSKFSKISALIDAADVPKDRQSEPETIPHEEVESEGAIKARQERMQAAVDRHSRALKVTVNRHNTRRSASSAAAQAKPTHQDERKRSIPLPEWRRMSYSTLRIKSNDALKSGKESPFLAEIQRILKINHFGVYSKSEVQGVKSMFRAIDVDNSGAIDVEEFLKHASNESNHLKGHFESMFFSMDKDNSGEIDAHEMLKVTFPLASQKDLRDMFLFMSVDDVSNSVKKNKKKRVPPEAMDELRRMFIVFDVNRDGSVTLQELQDGLQRNESHYAKSTRNVGLTELDLQDILDQFDADQNRVLDFEEFVELFSDLYC